MKNKIIIATLILVSVLLIISVIGLVNYKSAFEGAQASAIKWHNLSDQYLAELKGANRELDIANRAIFNQDATITALRHDIVKKNTQLTVANSQITTLERGGKDFDSLSALQEWLWEDTVNWCLYIPEVYDCDDFARDLVQSALEDGYRIGLFQRGIHIMNFAYIGNTIYTIEPQTDEVRFWGYRD